MPVGVVDVDAHVLTRTVRVATSDDLASIVALLRRFWAGSIYREFGAESVTHLEAVANGIVHGSNSVAFVALENDCAVGTIGLILAANPFSGDVMAHEIWWWVNPESRGHGIGMFRMAERWARERGAVFMQVSAPTERVGEFYVRSGYVKVETAYQRKL